MDLWQGLILITTVHLFAAASPGPDFVMVSQQSLQQGRRAGLWTSVGIALGLSVHIIYSIFGLATVIANSNYLLWTIKVLGGGYLIYLGINGIRAQPAHTAPDNLSSSATHDPVNAPHRSSPAPRAIASPAQLIRRGFLCNALNPKAPVYFVALFTIVLSPAMPLYQLIIYGVWIMMVQLAWFSALSVLLSQPAINQRFQQCGHWIDRLLGAAMLALGVKVLLSRIG